MRPIVAKNNFEWIKNNPLYRFSTLRRRDALAHGWLGQGAISQPRMNDLLRGRISCFSLDDWST